MPTLIDSLVIGTLETRLVLLFYIKRSLIIDLHSIVLFASIFLIMLSGAQWKVMLGEGKRQKLCTLF